MSSNSELKTSQDAHLRAKQIKSLIRSLKQKIKKIEQEGEVAPANCYILRYQVNRNGTIYWYYKLQAAESIFPMATNHEKKTKYKYLGRAGSEAHLDAVEKLTRRNIIDELERVIQSLTESYLHIYIGTETE
jgi:hypothetical protein